MQPQTSAKPRKFGPEYNQRIINDPNKRPETPADFAAYTGLSRKRTRQWHQDPQAYIHQLLTTALEQVAAVPAPASAAVVTTRDKVKAVCGAGSLGFSVSFMLAKAWASLWGFLPSLSQSDPRLFFLVGAAGFDLIASFLHATVAKTVAFGPGANYGGPQAPDKAAFDNYVTLLGMWYVASAQGDAEKTQEIAAALQELVDGVIARAQAEQDKGTPLSFDFREHPLVGAWLRNQHFHWAFFSYSVVYLFSGSLAPHLRLWIEQLSATVAQKAGLFALSDFLVSVTLGQFAGASTLGLHMLGYEHLQHGVVKPGLHQTWRQEQPVALKKCLAVTPSLLELVNIRSAIEASILDSPLSPAEKRLRLAGFEAQVRPLLDPAIEQLQRVHRKYQRRSALLETTEGRNQIAREKTGAIVFEGAGKTAHKLINRSPAAIRLRTTGEVVGNMLAMLAQAYSMFYLYTLFASTMPFTDTSASVPFGAPLNGSDSWAHTGHAGFINGTQAGAGVPEDTQLYSTWAGWILIAAFSLRAGLIPATELLLNLFYAAMVWMGHPADPRQASVDTVETVETDDSEDNPPPPTYRPGPPLAEPAIELTEVEVDDEQVPDEEPTWSPTANEASRHPPSSVANIENLWGLRGGRDSEAATVIENSVDPQLFPSDDSSDGSEAESSSEALPPAKVGDQIEKRSTSE